MTKPTFKIATLAEAEHAHVSYALQVHHGDRHAAGAALDVRNSGMTRLLKKHGLLDERGNVRSEQPHVHAGFKDALDAEEEPVRATILVECPSCSAENEQVIDGPTACAACGFVLEQIKLTQKGEPHADANSKS
jgi:hypothetical protein